MRRHLTRGRRIAATAGAFAVAAILTLGGCSETLLEAPDPDLIDPASIQNVEGALGLRNGALDRFRDITAGDESTWLFGGLLADEWSTSSTFIQNDEADQRKIQENNGSVTAMFRRLSRVRTTANQAIAALRKFQGDAPTRITPRMIAEMYFARGFAEMQMAQDFCNGIPLSEATGDSLVFGDPLSVEQVFQRAVASYDSALALSTGTDTASVSINRAARIGRARALLGLNRHADAAALVPAATVPTTYSYNHTFAVSSGDNILWSQPASQRRYTVGDSLEGNARNLLVRNAIPFFSAQDPRLPVRYTVSARGDTTRSQDGFTFSRTTTLYGRTTSVSVVNGLDARLVEAEARLKANDIPGMLAILNALRAAPPRLGEVQPTAASLPPLAAPATTQAAENLFFREKAFWTFTRGQRLGDLRRLIRQYGRTPQNTFPVGTHYRGGEYGTDVNLPVPTHERNNPKFQGCTNRSA